MAGKKFNFKMALQDSASALAGGAASQKVVDLIADTLPEQAEYAPIAPAVLGFYLSQQKNKMLSAAGLGMIGASSAAVLARVGIDAGVNGVGRSSAKRLSARDRKKMIAKVQQMQESNAMPSGLAKNQMTY